MDAMDEELRAALGDIAKKLEGVGKKVRAEDIVGERRNLEEARWAFEHLHMNEYVEGIEVAEELYPIFITRITRAGWLFYNGAEPLS